MNITPNNLAGLADQIRQWGNELGFQQVGFGSIELDEDEQHLKQWLAAGRHGTMDYMVRHGKMRSRPAELLPGTLSVISARMDYLPDAADAWQTLAQRNHAYVSRYALGRDYHKLLRPRLAKLAERIRQSIGELGYRVFVDSAPVLEKALARNSGLGWIGKHTNLINREAGSWFFLGEIFVDLPLPPDQPVANHCGSCRACLDVCPTQAIIAPYQVDARRCISYLTIENRGAIPVEFREAIGNRIYGCDDCQLVCPWNKFAKLSCERDFQPRHELDRKKLVELFAWSENEFLQKTKGSAIRRAGYAGWLRNVAVALGNAEPSKEVIATLNSRKDHPDEMVREHIEWALEKQLSGKTPRKSSSNT
ncbi:MAG: tRNA epoxyqueuosine(34) reductase QueG [Proteobacteria bacterium]|nr:tRNA epoxyqueuosine(34) reductase QueG [Pseudomonadota bacterium]